MAWSWSKGYTNPPGSSTTPPASTPPATTPPATTPSTGDGLSGLRSGLEGFRGIFSGPPNPAGGRTINTADFLSALQGLGGSFGGSFGGSGSGGVNTNPPGPGGEYSTPQVGPTTPPRFPGQDTPGGGLGGGGNFDWRRFFDSGGGGISGGSGGSGGDFSSILSGLRDRFGQGGTGTPGTGGTPFGEMPINGLPQGLQSTIANRWATIGGGQPMPTTLGPFFDAAKTYYQANPPIRPEWRDKIAGFLGQGNPPQG